MRGGSSLPRSVTARAPYSPGRRLFRLGQSVQADLRAVGAGGRAVETPPHGVREDRSARLDMVAVVGERGAARERERHRAVRVERVAERLVEVRVRDAAEGLAIVDPRFLADELRHELPEDAGDHAVLALAVGAVG